MVRDLFDTYPMPPAPFTEPAAGFDLPLSFEIAHYARSRKARAPDGARVLMAGCGTGVELHSLCHNNPGVGEVIGIDFADGAVEVATDRIAHHELTACKVVCGDITQDGDIPAGPFDFITAMNVLAYVDDPLAVLRSLAGRLAPEGVLAIEIPDRAGRWPLRQVAAGFRDLGLGSLSVAEAVREIRAIVPHAKPGSLLHMVTAGPENEAYYRHDAHLVHAFLNDRGEGLGVAETAPLLAEAGLEMMEMADTTRWRLAAVVDSQCREFYERIQKIDPMARLTVMEGLHPLGNNRMIFWACHAGAVTSTFDYNQELFLQSTWKAGTAFRRFARVTDDPRLGAGHFLLDWPLFYPSGQAGWGQDWQQDLLNRLADKPLEGSAILATYPEQVRAEIVKWFYNWEKDMVVMRV